MEEALSSSETSVLTRATRYNIPEDTILHSHRRENFKSYIVDVKMSLLVSNYITVRTLRESTRKSIQPEVRDQLHAPATVFQDKEVATVVH
jgi:hypothetical protein